jgi:hypothetical protein
MGARHQALSIKSRDRRDCSMVAKELTAARLEPDLKFMAGAGASARRACPITPGLDPGVHGMAGSSPNQVAMTRARDPICTRTILVPLQYSSVDAPRAATGKEEIEEHEAEEHRSVTAILQREEGATRHMRDKERDGHVA